MVYQVVYSPSLTGTATLNTAQSSNPTVPHNAKSCLKVRGRYLRQEDVSRAHQAQGQLALGSTGPTDPDCSPYALPGDGSIDANQSPYHLPGEPPASNPADWGKLYPADQYAQLRNLQADIDVLLAQVKQLAAMTHQSPLLQNDGCDRKKTHPAEEGSSLTVI